MRVLHLAPAMKMGHGVSEVIAAISREWATRGIYAAAGCQESDGHFTSIPTRKVAPDPLAVADLAARLKCRVIVAHGSPFFEVLPAVPPWFTTVAYEHGDPTPEMFVDDAAARRNIVERKLKAVYPHVSGVIAISEFIREDIAWPSAVVIRSGVDHIPDQGTKQWVPERPGSTALRVGTLMRLGAGEAQYKGTNLLPAIRDAVADLYPGVQFEVMGRGTPQDADALRAQGLTVHLNASDEERSTYLRTLDVFVSPSLWEGMNLPLVEAQALGTPGLAFDTGAHPEFTPLVFDSLQAMAAQVAAYGRDRGLLQEHGRMSYHYVRDGLTWESTARGVEEYLRERLAADTSGKAAAPYLPRRRLLVPPDLVPKVRRRLGRYRAAAKTRLQRAAAKRRA